MKEEGGWGGKEEEKEEEEEKQSLCLHNLLAIHNSLLQNKLEMAPAGLWFFC